MEKKSFIPALRFNFLTSLFDPLLKWTARETTFKKLLLTQAQIQANQKVLDLGCGTGTLAIMAKENQPAAELHGIDADPTVLKMAQEKSAASRCQITWTQGFSDKLPFESDTFDKVLSSLFFHHLTTEKKKATLLEVFRVLRNGGELHIADWGKAQNWLMRALYFSVQLLDGFATTQANVEGILPQLFLQTGFRDVDETKRISTVYGTLSLYSCRK